MSKVIYRENAEFNYEHVSVVDGEHVKVEDGELFIRELNDTWTRCEGPWELTDAEIEEGVYLREEAA